MSILKGSLGFKGEKGDNGVSPTVEVSKVDGTATITITDVEGEHTTTISDGEITSAMIIDDLTHTDTNKPLSANQGKVLKTAVDNCYTKTQTDALLSTKADKSSVISNASIAVFTGTIDLEANTSERLAENRCTLTSKSLGDYPTGFTVENCICISIELARYSSQDQAYTAGYFSHSVADAAIVQLQMVSGYPRGVSKGSEGLSLYVGNYTTTAINGLPYKVVLMKLPANEE